MTTTPTNGTTFSANAPHSTAFIVYINGIEVPVKSVSTREAVWQVPQLVIEMVADPVLTRLGAEDRAQVTVFYLDDTKAPRALQPEPVFRLLGEGEISGWGYQNTPGGRSIVFNCDNQFAIFQQLFVQFLTNIDDMVAHRSFSDTVAVQNVTSQLIFPFSLFKQGLVGKGPGQDPDSIRHPFDFLYNTVKNMIGSNIPEAQRTIPAANFFARWARLTNFVNRFLALPMFDEGDGDINVFPVLKALQTVHAVDIVAKNLIPQVQNQGSIMDMLQLVYQTVFMEVAMLMRMPLLTVDLKSSAVKEETKFENHHLITLDRTARDKKLTELRSKKEAANLAATQAQTAFTNAKSPEEAAVFQQELTKANATLATLENQTNKLTKTIPPEKPNPLKPNRIPNYFAKPQMLFGLPPSCNVIFPSQIKMLAYEENYATQPTRLYFNDELLPALLKLPHNGLGKAIQNALTLGWPPEVAGGLIARERNPKSNGKNFLIFPEEFFKGPVMDRRPIPMWLYFLRQQELTAAQQTGVVAGVTVGAASGEDPAKEDLYEKLRVGNPDVYKLYAQYEFFRERYSKRSGSAVLAFNPYIVPGFPAAIFDQRATRVDLFCYIITVQQKLSQRGHETTVSYTYGRTIQEMFDLMSTEFSQGALAAGVGPREPIKDIRQVIQNFDEAEKFYRKLFFGDRTLPGKKAVFDWREIIGYAPEQPGKSPTKIYVSGTGEVTLKDYATASEYLNKNVALFAQKHQEFAKTQAAKNAAEETIRQIAASVTSDVVDIDIDNPAFEFFLSTVQKAELKQASALLAQTTKDLEILGAEIAALEPKLAEAESVINKTQKLAVAVTHNLVADRALVPLPGKESLFQSYDSAMAYNWRPICTLDEYVIFHDSAGEETIPAFGHPRSLGAKYYGRIRRLTPLTDETVLPRGADGINAQSISNPAVATEGTPDPNTGESVKQPSQKVTAPGLTGAFPQTREDWDKILLEYRQNAYNVSAPRT